jgi:hypothetical protein
MYENPENKFIAVGWHIHIGNCGNCFAAYVGVSLGDARGLDLICGGVNLEEHHNCGSFGARFGKALCSRR